MPLPFAINTVAIAGSALWGLALYLGLSPLSGWIIHQFERWLNFAERFMYTSEREFERTRQARESQNAFLASLMSIVPFLVVGALVNFGVEFSLGRSWGISTGILACVSCGIYELGRRSQTL
ncbi:hypothetical protein C7271_08320 [filamentous cyanobacterium CCP5]|nr:hypothetical protein C7271_08320 [filamentous cyanobacterium CCP5]